MKEKTILKKWISFELNECNAMKEYLEKMALKGWKLQKIKTIMETMGLGKPLFSIFVFEKIQPQKLVYAVEVIDKITLFGGKPEEQEQEYLEFCKEAGWQFVSGYSRVHVFVSDDLEIVPIETDEKMKFETITKSAVKHNLIGWFIIPLIVLWIINSGELKDRFMFNFYITSPLLLLDAFIAFVYFVSTLLRILRYTFWYSINRVRVAKDKTAKYIGYSAWKRHQALKMIAISVLWLFCCWAMTITLEEYRDIFIYMHIILITTIGPFLVLRKLLNLFVEIPRTGLVKLMMGVLAVTFMIVLMNNIKQEPALKEIDPILSFEDIGINTDKEVSSRSLYKDNFLINYFDYSLYYDIPNDESLSGYDSYYLDLLMIESKYPIIIKLYVNSFLKQIYPPFVSYKEIDSWAWKAEHVYFSAPDYQKYPNSFAPSIGVVVYKNRVLIYHTCRLFPNDIPADDQINTIVEKLHLTD